MGLLSKLRVYPGKWNETNRESFDESDIQSVVSNEVVPSEYGNSVKLVKKDGQVSFLPISNTSREVAVGESVDLAKCFLLTLSRTGDDDIYRIEVK